MDFSWVNVHVFLAVCAGIAALVVFVGNVLEAKKTCGTILLQVGDINRGNSAPRQPTREEVEQSGREMAFLANAKQHLNELAASRKWLVMLTFFTWSGVASSLMLRNAPIGHGPAVEGNRKEVAAVREVGRAIQRTAVRIQKSASTAQWSSELWRRMDELRPQIETVEKIVAQDQIEVAPLAGADIDSVERFVRDFHKLADELDRAKSEERRAIVEVSRAVHELDYAIAEFKRSIGNP